MKQDDIKDCEHVSVRYSPVESSSGVWSPVWICEKCHSEFVPKAQVDENKMLMSAIRGYRRDIDNCLAELAHKNKVLRGMVEDLDKARSEGHDAAVAMLSRLRNEGDKDD